MNRKSICLEYIESGAFNEDVSYSHSGDTQLECPSRHYMMDIPAGCHLTTNGRRWTKAKCALFPWQCCYCPMAQYREGADRNWEQVWSSICRVIVKHVLCQFSVTAAHTNITNIITTYI